MPKIELCKKEKKFDDFSIKINITNEEDAVALFSLFNHTTVADFLHLHSSFTSSHVRDVIRKGVGSEPNNYSKTFNKLSEMIRNHN